MEDFYEKYVLDNCIGYNNVFFVNSTFGNRK